MTHQPPRPSPPKTSRDPSSPSSSNLHSAQRSILGSDPLEQPSSASIADLTTDHILLDKLAHYLDLVELHLVQEISLRSSSFFSALGNLQSLHAQTSASVAQIEALKYQLDQLKQTVADRALMIIRFGLRRKNISNLELALSKIRQVWQTIHEIDQMIQSGEWHSALGLIEELELVWRSTRSLSSTPTVDRQSTETDDSPTTRIKFRLNKIKALGSLPKRLSVFRSTISKALGAELNAILLHDLRINLSEFASSHPLDQSDSKDIKSPHSSTHDDIRQMAKDKLKERVRPTFHGLIRSGGSDKALTSWREDVVKQIRETVKSALSGVIEGDLDDKDDELEIAQINPNEKRHLISEKTMTLARNLKALSHTQFLKVALETYQNLLGCIQLIDTQSRALLELLEEHKPNQVTHPQVESLPDSNPTLKPKRSAVISDLDPPVPISSTTVDIETFSLKLNEIVQVSAEIANARFAKVIGVRTEVHAQLKFIDFFAIFDASWRFVVQCEVISRRMIIALRGVMVSQAKAFLQCFHQNKITESARIVEQEQWSPVEVPYQVQQTVNAIIRSAMEDPKSLTIVRDPHLTPSSSESPDDGQTNSSSVTKLLDIEGTCYHPVSASLETLKTVADYLSIVINCSLLTTDLMAKIIEFLKAFNSRTCQVVLGAGAIRSAGLKNITAKHLALASQALSTMINLIPYIRECIRRHLNTKQAVMLIDFDKLKRDYQEHQNEVHAKLISIMADRLAIHKQTLQSIDWEGLENSTTTDQDGGNGPPNAYLESLIKEVATLHRVLGRYLSPSALQDIMSQVFSSIHSVLAEEFEHIELKSVRAKKSLIRDARFFLFKLNEMKATEELQADAKSLEDLVHNKPLPKGLSINNLIGNEPKSPTQSELPSPSSSPLADRAESFRARFRFLSPRGRTSSSILAEVSESTAPTEEISATCSPTPEPASTVPETTPPTDDSTPNQPDDLTQQKQSIESSLSREEETQEEEIQPSTEPPESQAVPEAEAIVSVDEPRDEMSRSVDLTNPIQSPPPTTSHPLKLSLSQRLAALASSRRTSYSFSSSSSPTHNVTHQSSTVGSDMTEAPPISTLPVVDPSPGPAGPPSPSKDLGSVTSPTLDDQNRNQPVSNATPSVKPQPLPRLSFKERLAAIAAKAASAPTRSVQSVESGEKQPRQEELETETTVERLDELSIDRPQRKQAGTLLLSNQDRHFLTLEQLKDLPALPPSPSIVLSDHDHNQSCLQRPPETVKSADTDGEQQVVIQDGSSEQANMGKTPQDGRGETGQTRIERPVDLDGDRLSNDIISPVDDDAKPRNDVDPKSTKSKEHSRTEQSTREDSADDNPHGPQEVPGENGPKEGTENQDLGDDQKDLVDRRLESVKRNGDWTPCDLERSINSTDLGDGDEQERNHVKDDRWGPKLHHDDHHRSGNDAGGIQAGDDDRNSTGELDHGRKNKETRVEDLEEEGHFI